MHSILKEIGLAGIIPVIALEKAEDAEPLAQSLIEGGLPCAEVTFRTGAAEESIERMAKAYPAMLLGAGTVLTVDQVKIAMGSGAKYIVSPGLNPKVVEYCLTNNIPITPGVATPTEIEVALGFGLEVVKFFPAEASGGLDFLKAISAPYRNIKFIPTGGINEKNLLSYLRFNRILACGGSWMVKSDLISSRKFDEIKRLTAAAVHLMLGFDLHHIGINSAGEAEAAKMADQLHNILGLPLSDGNDSLFVGTQFEILQKPSRDAHGRIVIATNSVERAIAHLGRRQIGIRPGTKHEKDGILQTVYLDLEVGGFALCLVQA